MVTDPRPTGSEELGRRHPVQDTAGDIMLLDGPIDEQTFFRANAVCPVSETHFEYLHVRTGAVKLASRDTDFRITYLTVDPLFYAVVACPQCGYAAYGDEFETLDDRDRDALLTAFGDRERFGDPITRGERTLDAAAAAFDRALECDAVRQPDQRRRAGLLHRRAWLERSRGDEAAERALLEQAVAAYRAAFEQDDAISGVALVRAVYLIGELSLRLDDPHEASRWLLMCVQMPEAKEQTGVVRMARERLIDAHAAVEGQQRTA